MPAENIFMAVTSVLALVAIIQTHRQHRRLQALESAQGRIEFERERKLLLKELSEAEARCELLLSRCMRMLAEYNSQPPVIQQRVGDLKEFADRQSEEIRPLADALAKLGDACEKLSYGEFDTADIVRRQGDLQSHLSHLRQVEKAHADIDEELRRRYENAYSTL